MSLNEVSPELLALIVLAAGGRVEIFRKNIPQLDGKQIAIVHNSERDSFIFSIEDLNNDNGE